MDEDFSLLLLFLEFALRFPHSSVLLLPVLGADWVPSGLDNDSLEGFDAFAHLLVQLLLHRVQMEGNVLAEARDESERLIDALWSLYMRLLQFNL